jgi:hypothetical protein
MSRLVGELGKATGLKLSVSSACANDVLVISVAGVPVKDLMNEIAKVDSGEWKPDGDSFIFSADVIARRSEARHENEHQGSLIQALVTKKLAEAKQAAKNPPQGGPAQTLDFGPFGGGSGPDNAAILSLLKGLDPALLVVDANHRVVFSTHPNQVQLPLGSDADSAISQVVEAHNKSIPEGADKQDPTQAVTDPQAAEFLKQYIGRTMKRIDGYSKADLVVSTMPYLGGLSATLILYGPKGDILLSANDPLDMSILDMFIGKKPAETGTKTPIELSPESQAYLKFITGSQGAPMSGTARPVPPVLRPFLTDPQQHDPLSLLPTDKLLGLAKSSQKPLVAVVPDTAMSLLASVTGAQPTVEDFVDELDKAKSMVMKEENGWIEIKPIAPESARENRTDRKALATLLHAAQAKRIPSLDDMAEFAEKAPSPTIEGVSQVYLSLFVGGGMGSGFDGFTNWDMYRIYGQISPDRRQALLAGGKVPLDSLTPAQQSYLTEMVYGPLAKLQVGPPTAGDSDIMSQMMSFSMGGKDYKDEPTELLPSGVPGGGSFEMTSEEQPILSPVSSAGDGFEIPQVVGVDELAMLKFFSEQPQFAKVSGMMPKFDKMKLGSRVVYHLTFHLTNNIRLTGTLNDSRLPSDADTVSMNDLPKGVQDQIAKKTDDLKKSPLGAISSLGALGAGAGAPPP